MLDASLFTPSACWIQLPWGPNPVAHDKSSMVSMERLEPALRRLIHLRVPKAASVESITAILGLHMFAQESFPFYGSIGPRNQGTLIIHSRDRFESYTGLYRYSSLELG